MLNYDSLTKKSNWILNFIKIGSVVAEKSAVEDQQFTYKIK